MKPCAVCRMGVRGGIDNTSKLQVRSGMEGKASKNRVLRVLWTSGLPGKKKKKR
jgi:hypothetical protein